MPLIKPLIQIGGNSYGLILDKSIRDQVDLPDNGSVEIVVDGAGGQIILRPQVLKPKSKK